MLDFLLPLLLIGLGVYFYFFTPENQNQTFAYKTKASLQSPETFHYAHRYLGKFWLVLGICLWLVYLILSFIPLHFFVRSSLFFMLFFLTLFISIIMTEHKIKQ